MEALISVIVPVYKVEKYLDQCINSIVNQTYRNLEIILVDDGSPDGCPQMCEAWAKKDSRIRVIHKENQGIGMARNTGIDHATGAYICFFDSDDYISLETIAKAYAAAMEHHSDIVIFGMQRVNDHGVLMPEGALETPCKYFHGKDVLERFLPDLIDNSHRNVQLKNFPMSAWSCLFSMELIRELNWRFVSERDIISEDCYSLIWLYKYVNGVAVVPEKLYFYRDNPASITKAFRLDRPEKNQKFYLQCIEMAAEQGMGREVLNSIAALYLGFTIAAVKHLVLTKLEYKQKIRILHEILDNAVLHSALERIRDRNYGLMKNLLFWVMKQKLCHACYLLFVLRDAREKLNK